MTALTFIILALGAFRVTRLAIEDDITEPLRKRTVYRLPDGYWKDLLTCGWCLGFWCSLVVVVLYVFVSTVTWWVMLPFAISAVVGLIFRNLD